MYVIKIGKTIRRKWSKISEYDPADSHKLSLSKNCLTFCQKESYFSLVYVTCLQIGPKFDYGTWKQLARK